jgi:hypothetical protein
MSDTEKILLDDKSVYPTDDHIFSLIGERKAYWQMIMNHIASEYKDSQGSWNFYNDGKRWLFKMTRKKKTIFWAGLIDDTFRITFYLGNKAEPVIESSELSMAIKEEFRTAKRYGLIRPVSFLIRDGSDVSNVLKMIEIKSKLK